MTVAIIPESMTIADGWVASVDRIDGPIPPSSLGGVGTGVLNDSGSNESSFFAFSVGSRSGADIALQATKTHKTKSSDLTLMISTPTKG